ncbi:MAG: fatty acid desaturase family protein [Steroidobacteraceae bacterium]
MEARELIKDLFEPRDLRYWADFLLSLSIAYAAVALYLSAAPFSAPFIACFSVAAFALFRCGVFMHELVHLPARRLRVFRVAWNVLFGIPALTPSFMYKCHADHHNPRHFGTSQDGEYLPLGAGPVRRILIYLIAIPILPALPIVRFLVLTPVSLLSPRLRRAVLERASSYVINPTYRRTLPSGESRRAWVALEVAIFLELAVFFGLLLAGALAWTVLAELYVLGVAAAGLNWLRTLAAHGYRNTGAPMTFRQQIEDSIGIAGHPLLTELLFPVGLRYHSLHHWFPALPYHSLGAAHARLMRSLPQDCPYRRTLHPSFTHALREMWRSARSAAPEPLEATRERAETGKARSQW